MRENASFYSKCFAAGFAGILFFHIVDESHSQTIAGDPMVAVQQIRGNEATVTVGETSLKLGQISCGLTKATEPYGGYIAISGQVQTAGPTDLYPAIVKVDQIDQTVPISITPVIRNGSTVVATCPTITVNTGI